MPKGYTDKTTIENYILKTIDVTFGSQIDSWIESVEAFIDGYTGRSFVAGDDDEGRLFDGNNESELLIDDCLDIETLTIDGTKVDEDNYWLYPANSERKYKIRLDNAYFTRGHQNISITGQWGYCSAVPADIKLAATVFVAGIISFSNQSPRSETIGAYSISYDNNKNWQDFDQAMKILQLHRKISF